MKEFQDKCVEYDERLSEFLVPIKKAHITLAVLHVPEEKLEEATQLFQSVIETKIIGAFEEGDSFKVVFDSIGTFSNKVIFAKPHNNIERMEFMHREFHEAFTQAGYYCDSKFTLHLTLLKKGFGKGLVNKVPPEAYERLKDMYFGVQEFSGIQFLSMSQHKPEAKDGYYNREAEYLFKIK